jgi:hypothetical protein
MKLQEIEWLLEKYYNGETTLNEEKALFEYFAGQEVPPRFKTEKLQFEYLGKLKGNELDDPQFDKKVMKKLGSQGGLITRIMENRSWFYATAGMAATILILIAVFVRFDPFPKKFQDTYSDPETAYKEAQKVLFFVSKQFNRGADKLQPISTYNDGVKELENLKVLNEGITAASKIKKYNKIEQIMTNTN